MGFNSGFKGLGAVMLVFLISDNVYVILKQKTTKKQNYNLFIYLFT